MQRSLSIPRWVTIDSHQSFSRSSCSAIYISDGQQPPVRFVALDTAGFERARNMHQGWKNELLTAVPSSWTPDLIIPGCFSSWSCFLIFDVAIGRVSDHFGMPICKLGWSVLLRCLLRSQHLNSDSSIQALRPLDRQAPHLCDPGAVSLSSFNMADRYIVRRARVVPTIESRSMLSL